MKKFLFVIVILLACFITLVAFTTNSLTTTETVVLRDVTDTLLSAPQADEIFPRYDLTENKWNGAIFRFVDLSEVSFNRVTELNLATANEWLSNEPEREKQIRNFKNNMAEILSRKETIGRTHSSVYLPVARELNRLSQNKSDKKILLIYSDLMENTPEISFYAPQTFRLLQSNPDSVKKLFEKMQTLHPLSGIEVHFIFQPKDITQDTEFKIVSEFYRRMLEEKGAQVFISANL